MLAQVDFEHYTDRRSARARRARRHTAPHIDANARRRTRRESPARRSSARRASRAVHSANRARQGASDGCRRRGSRARCGVADAVPRRDARRDARNEGVCVGVRVRGVRAGGIRGGDGGCVRGCELDGARGVDAFEDGASGDGVSERASDVRARETKGVFGVYELVRAPGGWGDAGASGE